MTDIETIIGRQSEGLIIRGFVNQKWVPYSQRYLFNAIPDTNHNVNPTNPTNPTNLILGIGFGLSNPRIIEPSDYRYITIETTIQSFNALYSVSQKSSPHPTFCNVFTWAKYIYVKFCQLVAILYPQNAWLPILVELS